MPAIRELAEEKTYADLARLVRNNSNEDEVGVEIGMAHTLELITKEQIYALVRLFMFIHYDRDADVQE